MTEHREHAGHVHDPRSAAARARAVAIIALVTMAAEILVGLSTGSLALLADGWHMATHVGALGLACLAYWYGQRAHGAGRFAFGPGKMATLAGYTNALVLGLVAVFMLVESVERLAEPRPVRFGEAFLVALLGLVVNVISARVLAPRHSHDHHDHNLRSAYLHVLADVLTSVLALVALGVGHFTGQARFDAGVGIVGGAVILWWAVGLLRSTVPELTDMRPDADPALAALRKRLEAGGDATVKELRLWPIGSGRSACQLSLVVNQPRAIEEYRRIVLEAGSIDHVIVEIHATGPDPVRRSA